MTFDGVLRAFSRKGPLHFYTENAKLWFAVLPLACRNNAGMFDFPVPLRPFSCVSLVCFRGGRGGFSKVEARFGAWGADNVLQPGDEGVAEARKQPHGTKSVL